MVTQEEIDLLNELKRPERIYIKTQEFNKLITDEEEDVDGEKS